MTGSSPRSGRFTVPPATAPRPDARLPLHDRLYLLAHDVDHGNPHMHTGSLAVGLAGAALVELLLDGTVSLWDTRIHVELIGLRPDPITEAAAANLRAMPVLPTVDAWLRGFATTDLYQRVRANLLAVGILRHHTRRLRPDRYPPVNTVWTIRARGHLRAVLYGREPANHNDAALCGLVDALSLQAHVAFAEPTADIRARLRHVASAHLPPVRHVTSAVADVVGSLALAPYR